MDIPALHTLTNGIIIGICLSISFGLVCFKAMRTFNRNFRELVKMTPTEFRQQKSVL